MVMEETTAVKEKCSPSLLQYRQDCYSLSQRLQNVNGAAQALVALARGPQGSQPAFPPSFLLFSNGRYSSRTYTHTPYTYSNSLVSTIDGPHPMNKRPD